MSHVKLNLPEEVVSTLLDGLEKIHRDLFRKAESWSFDLEGDYENYLKARAEEAAMAHTIHIVKVQRTLSKNGQTADAPLADWEVELLTGRSNKS